MTDKQARTNRGINTWAAVVLPCSSSRRYSSRSASSVASHHPSRMQRPEGILPLQRTAMTLPRQPPQLPKPIHPPRLSPAPQAMSLKTPHPITQWMPRRRPS